MRRRKWQRPTREQRAEHIETLHRLGERILDRASPIPIWFVLMSGFEDDQLPIALEH